VIKRLLDALWLVLLVALVFAIPPTFHGDEAMYLSMSRDYATVFFDGDLAALRTEPPYYVDSDQQLRLLNGSVQRYAAGFLWHLAGATIDDLPTRPGWNWSVDYDTNLATGHVPTPTVLAAGRLASSIFLALSIVAIFVLAWQFGGRLSAHVVSALYALNPIILLNGRRSMQEGSMLLFGIFVVLVAVTISRRRFERQPTPLTLWVALIVTAALALASKHSAVVFVGGAFGWIFITEILRRPSQPLLTVLRLGGAGLLVVALVIALSPALWSDPRARFADILQNRAFMLDLQVTADPLAPTSLGYRAQQIITEPFMMPLEHFEVAGWATYQPIMDDVARYIASPFSGVQFGTILGGVVMLLAVIGAFLSLRSSWRAGVVFWLGITVASLLVNPLPWQRYFLTLIPVYALLAGIGLDGLVRRFAPKYAQNSVPVSLAGQAG
jgi:4-amino-4-deoxy-L-arabinose transferase-like glycosyltransferase